MWVGNDIEESTGAHSIILVTCFPERWENPWEQGNKVGHSSLKHDKETKYDYLNATELAQLRNHP
jgi:hypothetical protein